MRPVATRHTLACDHADTWSIFSTTDTEPTGNDLLCPQAGHSAIALAVHPLDRFLRITIAAAGSGHESRNDQRSRFFLELSTWDGEDRLLSAQTYTWEDAFTRAELFRNLSWEDAERRWRHLRMPTDDTDSPDPREAAADSRRDLSRSLAQLSEEIRQGTRVVENETTAAFLDAAAAWRSDIGSLYGREGEPISGAAWAEFGKVIEARLDYE